MLLFLSIAPIIIIGIIVRSCRKGKQESYKKNVSTCRGLAKRKPGALRNKYESYGGNTPSPSGKTTPFKGSGYAIVTEYSCACAKSSDIAEDEGAKKRAEECEKGRGCNAEHGAGGCDPNSTWFQNPVAFRKAAKDLADLNCVAGAVPISMLGWVGGTPPRPTGTAYPPPVNHHLTAYTPSGTILRAKMLPQKDQMGWMGVSEGEPGGYKWAGTEPSLEEFYILVADQCGTGPHSDDNDDLHCGNPRDDPNIWMENGEPAKEIGRASCRERV